MLSNNRFRVVAAAATLVLMSVTPSFAELTSGPEHVSGEAVVLQNDNYLPEKGGVMPVDLTLDDGTADTAIGDNGQFIWLNRFTPDPAEFPFQLEEVSAIISPTNVNIGDAIEIVVYTDVDGDGDPATGSVLVGSENVTVQANDGVTFNVWTLNTPILLNGPNDVLIGLINRYGFEGFGDFPASLDQTATQERSWAATYLAGDVPANPPLPGDEQWGLIDSFGFPGNWIIRGAGSTVLPPEPVIEVPTASHTGLMAFGALLLLAAVVLIWRRSV